MSRGGVDALDKEIAMLEKKLGVAGKKIKRGKGKQDKFLQDLTQDGMSEIFSFVDTLSVYNKKGKHNKLLEKEGDDLEELFNFDYNFDKVRLEKRRNSSDDDIFGENPNFEEFNEEDSDSGQNEGFDQEFDDEENSQENEEEAQESPVDYIVKQKVNVNNKTQKSILKKDEENIPKPVIVKDTGLDSQTRAKYQETQLNKLKDVNNEYGFKTGRKFCQDILQILNRLHDKYKYELLTILQETIYSSILKLDYNTKSQYDNEKKASIGSFTKIWIFSYLLKYLQLAMKDSVDNILVGSLEVIIVKLIKAMKLFKSVEKVEARHKKLLFMLIGQFDAKLIGKEQFVNIVVLIGEKLMSDCINDDLWLQAVWILRRNEPKGFVEMTKKQVGSDSWREQDIYNSYKSVQTFFKNQKFNVYEPKKELLSLYASSKKLESVLYNEFFEKIEEKNEEKNSLFSEEENEEGQDDDLSFDDMKNSKSNNKKDGKNKKGKKNVQEEQKVDPELKKFQEKVFLDINWDKCMNTPFNTDDFLESICNNKKKESDNLLKKRAHIEISDSKRQNLEKLATNLGFTSVLEVQTFIILMSSEGLFEALDKLGMISVKRNEKVDVVKVVVNCCLKESPYNEYYTKVLSGQISRDKNFKIGSQFAFWDQYRIFEQDTIANKSELVSFIKNFAKMFSELLIDDKLNLRAMRNFDISSEKDIMNSKQTMFMRLVIKEILEKMELQILMKSTETLKRNDEDMMFRDSLYDFLRKIYKKQFQEKDFAHKSGEAFQEIKAKLEMLISNIKVKQ